VAERRDSQRGSASVEQAGLIALVALLLVAAAAAIAAGGKVDAGRALAGALGRRIACAPRLPDACRHHPLVPAYGWPGWSGRWCRRPRREADRADCP
jgi:Flp pilus assembly pilin Flp